jgi:galactose mutarotase-like enzyme
MTTVLDLRSPSGELEASFAPEANLVCSSLRHQGEEVLGQRGGLEAYAERSSTMGVPLLHPWANRLSEPAFRAAGRDARFDPSTPLVKPDPNGLPIHGVVAGRLRWEVEDRRPAGFRARLRWSDDDLLGIFPFEHELGCAVALDDTGLHYETTLHATADAAVPVSFGYHPYLVLPGVPRAQWEVELPVRRHLVTDERTVPTGDVEDVREPTGPLGDRTYDDGYVDVPDGAAFVLAGGTRRLAIVFEHGYPCAQVFAPPDQELVAYEPMTAPTNALVTGDGLRVVQPGGSFSAAFRLEAMRRD